MSAIPELAPNSLIPFPTSAGAPTSMTREALTLPAPQPPLTGLIGREVELRQASELLRRPEMRLLTLAGTGGVGKSRLAVAVALDLRDQRAFEDGVGFVSLATVRDPALVVSEIAQALGIRDAGRQSAADAVINLLRGRQVLLLLDNFEQVADASPDVVQILGACPGLTVMVTSRTPLRVRGETVLTVVPLAISGGGAGPAVELFTERARQARPDFTAGPKALAAIEGICARLDGLPLAIELAASRIRLLPPDKLLLRLEQRLPLLTGGARDLPQRQQTLRNTIAWSFDLLGAEGQALFTALAVLSGGASLDAIEAILPGSGLDAAAALLDQSLVYETDGHDGEPRYGMLGTVREFALERLIAQGNEGLARERAAAHFLSLAERAEPWLSGPEQRRWLDLLDLEHDNLRAVLAWASIPERVEHALRLGGAIWRFWWTRGYYREGRAALAHALTSSTGLEIEPGVRAKALHAAAGLAWAQSDYDAAAAAAGEALAIWRRLDDPVGMIRALNVLGIIATDRGDYEQALLMHEENLRQCEALGERRGMGVALLNMSEATRCLGDDERSVSLLQQSLPPLRESGDAPNIAVVLSHLGQAAALRGQIGEARALYAEAIAIWRAMGSRGGVGIGTVLNKVGDLEREAGNFAAAAGAYGEGLTSLVPSGDAWTMAHCCDSIAGLANRLRQPASAVRLYASATSLREGVGMRHPPRERADQEQGIASAKDGLIAADFAGAWSQGYGFSSDEVIAEATRILAVATAAATSTDGVEPMGPAVEHPLSARELEVLRLLVAGKANREIGELLFISHRTVMVHVGNILAKLGVPTRTAAVAHALTNGLL